MSASGKIYQLGICSDFIQEAVDWLPTEVQKFPKGLSAYLCEKQFNRTLHFPWKFMTSLLARFSTWPRSHRTAANSSSVSTTPSSCVFANPLMVHSVPSSRSLTKILTSTGPSIVPWGTPPVPEPQQNITPLITTLWVWQLTQFSSHPTGHPPTLCDFSSKINTNTTPQRNWRTVMGFWNQQTRWAWLLPVVATLKNTFAIKWLPFMYDANFLTLLTLSGFCLCAEDCCALRWYCKWRGDFYLSNYSAFVLLLRNEYDLGRKNIFPRYIFAPEILMLFLRPGSDFLIKW